jgi:hypothetical protein
MPNETQLHSSLKTYNLNANGQFHVSDLRARVSELMFDIEELKKITNPDSARLYAMGLTDLENAVLHITKGISRDIRFVE